MKRGLIRRAFDRQLEEPGISMAELLFRWRTVQRFKAGASEPFADPSFDPRLTGNRRGERSGQERRLLAVVKGTPAQVVDGWRELAKEPS